MLQNLDKRVRERGTNTRVNIRIPQCRRSKLCVFVTGQRGRDKRTAVRNVLRAGNPKLEGRKKCIIIKSQEGWRKGRTHVRTHRDEKREEGFRCM